jgi:hypothetical protein
MQTDNILYERIDDTPIGRAVFREHVAAHYLSCSEEQLAKLRKLREGPPFVRLSDRLIGYRKADLDDWLSSRVQAPA